MTSVFLRLSEVAGAKLSESNAAITDLSDENRPQKLGEMFSEIYDNEWTDAYEHLTNHAESKMDEEDAICALSAILKVCRLAILIVHCKLFW